MGFIVIIYCLQRLGSMLLEIERRQCKIQDQLNYLPAAMRGTAERVYPQSLRNVLAAGMTPIAEPSDRDTLMSRRITHDVLMALASACESLRPNDD